MERVSGRRNVCVAIVLASCGGGSSGPRSSEAVIPPFQPVDAASTVIGPVPATDANPGAGTDDANPEAGDDGGGPAIGLLDCAFLTAPNCWQTAAATADSCVPEMNMLGTLSADGTMCVYPSGTVVTFQSPVVLNGRSSLAPFTVATGSVTCVSYAQPAADESSLTTDAGTVTLSVEDDGGVLGLTCPDGTMYAGPFAALSTCPNAVPGYNSAAGGLMAEDGATMDQLTLSLTGTGYGSDGELYVFGCQSP
jgi:hypothetical protein